MKGIRCCQNKQIASNLMRPIAHLIFDHYLENNQSLILHPPSLAVGILIGSNMMLVSPISSNRLPVQKGPLSICFEANRIILLANLVIIIKGKLGKERTKKKHGAIIHMYSVLDSQTCKAVLKHNTMAQSFSSSALSELRKPLAVSIYWPNVLKL